MKDDVSAVKNAAKIAVFGRPEGGGTGKIHYNYKRVCGKVSGNKIAL